MLARLRPAGHQTWLLRACLWSGDAALEAWKEHRRRAPGPFETLQRENPELRRLAPLLFVALRHEARHLDRPLVTGLRSAYAREQLRAREYSRILGEVIAHLDSACVPFQLFRGAALGETVYTAQVLRHSHDINVLVEPELHRQALQALQAAGFRSSETRRDNPDAVVLTHGSGLPVLVHSRFFRLSYYHTPWEALWSRRQAGTVAGRSVSTVSSADALLHACAQNLLCARPGALVWACDAAFILRRHPDPGWSTFLAAAAESRTRLAALVALRYLAEDVDCPVPDSVLTELDRASAEARPAERDVALLAARRGTWRIGQLLGARTRWRVKLTQIRWLALPSIEYLRWAYDVHHPLLVPVYYGARLGRYLIRGLRTLRTSPAPSQVPSSPRG
jgi:hypothetical protein